MVAGADVTPIPARQEISQIGVSTNRGVALSPCIVMLYGILSVKVKTFTLTSIAWFRDSTAGRMN